LAASPTMITLTPLNSTNPDDIVLTPGHFLVGRPILAPPTQSASHAKVSTLRRWQLVQRLSQDIWNEWKTNYLQTLHTRHKWTGGHHDFNIGDIVFLQDESFTYRRWPMARISTVFPGDDGIIRAVEVTCQGKTFRRSIQHLIPFISEDVVHPPTECPQPSWALPPVCSGPPPTGTEQEKTSPPSSPPPRT